MIIELRGVEFVNKGAELMLNAILQKIEEEFPEALFTMEHSSRAPRSKQLEHSIYTKTNIKKFHLNFKYILNLIPKSVRRNYYLISENEVNVILDASGFAFGDFWGAEKAGKRMANKIKRWKKNGIKVILLPQALGPFTNKDLIEKMSVIINNADLIFARDIYSYNFICDVETKSKNIYLQPDFTNLVKGTTPDYFDPKSLDIAIIPNNKLIEAKVFSEKEYMNLLNKMAEIISKKGLTPFFLIHEGAADLLLVKEINNNFNKDIKILKEDNPILVKGIIEKSKGVITARFHGLVSALSQAVPCVSLAWSHKYRALMEDYNYSIGLITKEETEKEEILLQKMELLLDEKKRTEVAQNLHTESIKHKNKTLQMWDMVVKNIK